jgi:ABC-type dipeptide/oligopeptide/nickel transport system ATPase component
MTALDLTVSSDERLGIIGQTGMGKTVLAEKLLEQQPRVIVVDSKERVNWKGYYLTDNPVAALLEEKVIYRPPGGVPPEDWWRAAMDSLVQRGGGVIYIDELPVVCSTSRMPKALADVFRVGRELGVTVWWAAQESTTIHNTTMRQSEQLVLFYNQGASDRDKITGIVGDMGEVTGHLEAYDFVVFVRGETYDHEDIPVYRAVYTGDS